MPTTTKKPQPPFANPIGGSERASLRLVRNPVRIRRTNTVRRHQSGGGEFYRHLTFEGGKSCDKPPEFFIRPFMKADKRKPPARRSEYRNGGFTSKAANFAAFRNRAAASFMTSRPNFSLGPWRRPTTKKPPSAKRNAVRRTRSNESWTRPESKTKDGERLPAVPAMSVAVGNPTAADEMERGSELCTHCHTWKHKNRSGGLQVRRSDSITNERKNGKRKRRNRRFRRFRRPYGDHRSHRTYAKFF